MEMVIFAIDDEPRLLRLLHQAIAEAAPQARILDYTLGSDALLAVQEEGIRPSFVFSDIRMPGLSGLQMAARLKQAVPETRIIFVTGYNEYALEALQIHANGYIMKPVTAERVRQELLYNAPELIAPPDKLQIRCFGYFEVFWHGEPLVFNRRQTKELLAYLVDRGGAVCTAEEIAAALWETESNIGAMKTRIRQLISDMRSTFASIGLDGALIRHRNQLALRREMVDCDYYRMLDGDMDAVNAYRGEYMTQYSWAELTEGRLYFQARTRQEEPHG